MVIIALKTILNEKVGYHCLAYCFGYDKKWFHVRNNYKYFYQNLTANNPHGDATLVENPLSYNITWWDRRKSVVIGELSLWPKSF